MNNYKDLSKKITYVYKNKSKLKTKVKTGYKYLYRFDEDKNLDMYYQIILKYLQNG